jgi:alcohol dehydrogenase class IV
MLPRTMQAMSARAPAAISALAKALGTPKKDLRTRIEQLSGGRRRLSELGADASNIDAAVEAILARAELQATPDPPDAAELRTLIESAW